MDVARPGGRVLSIGFDVSKYVTISIFYIFFIATKVRVVEMREVSENERERGRGKDKSPPLCNKSNSICVRMLFFVTGVEENISLGAGQPALRPPTILGTTACSLG